MRCSLLILSSYLDDELDPARRAEVDAHIIGCERCHKGLDYLREEVSHIGGLARVHLSDPAAHTFLQQLGLIGPDDDLPPRPPRPPTPPSGAPPWFTSGPARGALPWASRRSEPGPSDQPSLPFRDQAVLQPRGSPGWEALAAGDGVGGAGEMEVHLSGRAASGMGATEEMEAARSPESTAVTGTEAAASLPAPAGPGAADGTEPSPWSQAATGAAPFEELPLMDRLRRASLQGNDPWGWAPRDRPLPGAPPSPAAGPLPPAPSPRHPGGDEPRASPSWPAPAFPGSAPSPAPRTIPAPAPQPSSASAEPTAPPRADPVLRSAAPAAGVPPLARRPDGGVGPADRAGGGPTASGLFRSAAPASELAPWPPAGAERKPTPPPAQSPPLHPRLEGTPDPLIDPLIERAARPPRRLHPSLPGRLRDELALRVALARGTRRRAASAGDEILPDAFLGGGSAAVAEADGREAGGSAQPGPLEPAPRPQESGAPDWSARGGVAAARSVASPTPERSGGRGPTIAEELPAPPPRAAAPFRAAPLVRDAGWPSREAGRHSRALHDRSLSAGLPPWLARARSRWLAIAGGAGLLLVIVLLITLPGGTAPVTPHRAAASTHAAVSHPSVAPSVGAQAPAPAVSSAAPATPSVAPSPTPTATPAGPSQSFGGGGSGWQLENIRCCYVQGSGFTRVVFDMSGSGAAPRMTLSFPSPTTMLVSFAGATATGTFSAMSGGVITSMTPPAGSTATFQFALSRPVSVKDWNFLPNGDSSSPTPLIYFDLG